MLPGATIALEKVAFSTKRYYRRLNKALLMSTHMFIWMPLLSRAMSLNADTTCYKSQGPVVQSIVRLTSVLVKMITVLVITIPNTCTQVFFAEKI